MKRDEVLKAFDRIRVWSKNGERAPHKPLLVLYALGRLLSGEAAAVDYNEAEPKLRSLLEEFGPSRKTFSPNLPFWHLQTDGLWELDAPESMLARPPRMSASPTELRKHHVRGGFPPDIQRALIRDPELVTSIARRIVDAHFPDSIRGDVLSAVGLPVEAGSTEGVGKATRRRDPAFRERVLLAYQYRCGVCGLDLRLGRQTICLEAAHIKWFQANGPDIVPNGIALCSMHHKVFDLGVFMIRSGTYEMIFSQELNGSDDARGRLLSYHGANLIMPQSAEYKPLDEYLLWHARAVFKKPPRDLA
jgi:putative restriction endonuclease